MKLFNPTPEMIIGKCRGVAYIVDPSCFVELNTETGNWIKERYSKFGLVELDFKTSDKETIQKIIVQKSLEGLELYLDHLHYCGDQWIELDTELKQKNLYGTVLRDKDVKNLTKRVEQTTSMIKEIEKKYGVSLDRDESEEKTKNLLASIEGIVEEFEQDNVAQEKARVQGVETDKAIKDVLSGMSAPTEPRTEI